MHSDNLFSDKTFTKNGSEKGRSLIEIIAILVILAILLIAALLGFKALLDFLKKKETAAQISNVGMRYKTDRLGKVRKGDRKVSLKEIYPEGTECSKNDSTCVKTPDGGEIRVYSYENTTSFVVVATNIQPISCEEAIMAGGYTKVINNIEGTGLDFVNSDMVFNSATGEFRNLQYFKEHPEELWEFCQTGVAFLYTDRGSGSGDGNDDGNDCKHFYDGVCHNCPKDMLELFGPAADEDGCCAAGIPTTCNSCGGCPDNKPICKNETECVECVADADCPADRPYCDPRTNTCKPCRKIGDPCTPGSGSGMGGVTYCDDDLECGRECTPNNGRWIPDPKNPKGPCICNKKTHLGKDEVCDIDTDSTCQDECKSVFECKGPLYAKTCKCYDTTIVGAPCSDAECPCGKLGDGTQLICRNSKCINPNDETACTATKPTGLGLLPIDQRNKGTGCQYDPNCPCNDAAGNFLTCQGGKCACANTPTTNGADCWGECGCGTGLTCSATGAEMGKCSCEPAEHVGDPCSIECGCVPGLRCNSQYKCVCDPTKDAKTLAAGAACAGEGECPQQCKTTLCRETSDGTKKCCPEEQEPWCGESVYDSDGCLVHAGFDCPPAINPTLDLCDPTTHKCVQCLKPSDCKGDTYCGPDNLCTECPPPELRCDISANIMYEVSSDYVNCIKQQKFDCPPPGEPEKIHCDTSGLVCVECNSNEDCAGDKYCDPSTKTCNDCPTCADRPDIACCDRGPEKDANGCTIPKDVSKTVTHTKKEGDKCVSVTEKYCPLTEEKPADECQPCNACQKLKDGECIWKWNNRKTVCGGTCCVAGYNNCCGTHCCQSSVCNKKGDNCCESTSLGGTKTNVYSNGALVAYQWNHTENDYYVDSEQDMILNIHIKDILEFDYLRVYDKTSGSFLVKYPPEGGTFTGTSIFEEHALKSGHHYKIEVKLKNECSSCNIDALCGG